MSPPFDQPKLPHVEDCSKRIRVLFGGKFIVDTTQSKLVWEKPYYPVYYFPQDAVSEEYLHLAQRTSAGVHYDIVAGSSRAPLAATKFSDSPDRELAGLVKITFSAMDAWFEEDEQIYNHPKDPYKRVDVLHSSRHIRVEVNGVEVANSRAPRLLYETGLHLRTYLSKTDCRMDLLVPSDLTTACPYKGEANYYHVQLPSGEKAENIVWWYRNPNLECAAINNCVAFYDEKVDVWVDGVKQPRAQPRP